MNLESDKEANRKEMRLILLETNWRVFSDPLPGHREDTFVQHEVGKIADAKVARTVAALVRLWLTDGNPHFLDWALAYCHEREVGPTDTLWRLALKLAERRHLGIDPPSRRIANLKEQAKEAMFGLMGNLIYTGVTIERSVSVAASVFEILYPHLSSFKASSLEQLYRNQVQKPGIQEWYFHQLDEHDLKEELHTCFKVVCELVPEVSEELRGKRR